MSSMPWSRHIWSESSSGVPGSYLAMRRRRALIKENAHRWKPAKGWRAAALQDCGPQNRARQQSVPASHLKITQRKFQSPEVGVVVVPDRKSNINSIARQKRRGLQTFGHVPAESVENNSGPSSRFPVLNSQ